MEILLVDFYCRYLGGFFLTVKCLRFVDLGKKKVQCLSELTNEISAALK